MCLISQHFQILGNFWPRQIGIERDVHSIPCRGTLAPSYAAKGPGRNNNAVGRGGILERWFKMNAYNHSL